MKFLTQIVLFLFLAFLATPTIVSMIESDTDLSYVYNLSEEETHKEIKEIPALVENTVQLSLFKISLKSTFINSENLLKHDNVSEEIFSPPPEFS